MATLSDSIYDLRDAFISKKRKIKIMAIMGVSTDEGFSEWELNWLIDLAYTVKKDLISIASSYKKFTHQLPSKYYVQKNYIFSSFIRGLDFFDCPEYRYEGFFYSIKLSINKGIFQWEDLGRINEDIPSMFGIINPITKKAIKDPNSPHVDPLDILTETSDRLMEICFDYRGFTKYRYK